MSKIDDLIAELCPDGVEFVTLGDVCEISSAGVDKKIIEGEKPVRLLNYMDVYRNRHITQNILTMEVTAPISKVKKCNIEKGDIFITPTSETIDDIGHAAVAIETIEESVYSYHLMRLRLKEFDITTAFYISYVFASNALQKQILQLATGLTRFGLSKGNWEKVLILLPPLPIQEEIVRILDKFTTLEAELEKELEKRKKQYEYYRDSLLTFGDDVEWKFLGEMCSLITKGTTPNNFEKSGVSFIKTEAFDGSIINKSKLSYINIATHESSLKRSILQKNDILFTIAGATIGKCAIVNEDVLPANTNQALAIIRLNVNINHDYVFYLLQSKYMKEYICQKIKSSAQPNLNLKQLNDFPIPVPPLVEQKRIVAILDRFDALVNDITQGLPAEIETRRKQYEYYRDKLLTFKEKES